MNAIDLLECQHADVMEMLRGLEKSHIGMERAANFHEMKQALFAHMVIEEEVFYPVVAPDSSDGMQMADAYDDHVAARRALRHCVQVLHRESLFQICIGVLTEVLSQHIAEEQRTLFPRARKGLDVGQLEALGETMKTVFDNTSRSLTIGAELDLKSTVRKLHDLTR
jgi:iron-sulfur cluster repair protein YtfE (RIC family)